MRTKQTSSNPVTRFWEKSQHTPRATQAREDGSFFLHGVDLHYYLWLVEKEEEEKKKNGDMFFFYTKPRYLWNLWWSSTRVL